jgi:hypothetical protein
LSVTCLSQRLYHISLPNLALLCLINGS